MSVYETLDALHIVLPDLPPPVSAYVPFRRSGNLVFLSGHIAKQGGTPWVGQLGANLTTTQGRDAARGVAIDLLGTLHAAVGDLDRIKHILALMVLVNSTPRFTEHHLVANRASELFAQVFGERGTHTRSAFGVAQVPCGSCVEINPIAEVDDL